MVFDLSRLAQSTKRLWFVLKPHAVPALVFFLCFLAFFWRVFLRAELPLIGDPLAYSYPLRAVAWEMIRSGNAPLWTPYIFSGYPLLSMAQLGLGYPIIWAYLILPGHWAETFYVIVPFLLAPLFLYSYVREIGCSRLAAFIAGISFAYGGMMSSRLSNGMLPNAVMWLPLMLVAIERSRRRRFIPCLAGGAIAYSMSVLTGIGQGFVLVGMLAALYALFVTSWELVFHGRGRQSKWAALKPAGVVAGAFVISLGIAAFQILETLTAVNLSIRRELTYEVFGQLSLPFNQAWKALFIPLYFHIESAPFVAPIPLILAIVGAGVAIKSPARYSRAAFWLVVAAVSVILMAGSNTPVFRLLYEVPILNKFRGPSRHSFEWTLALSILAAFGWDAAASRFKRPVANQKLVRTAAVSIIVLAAIVALVWIYRTYDPAMIHSGRDILIAVRGYSLWKILLFGFTSLAIFLALRIEWSQLQSAVITAALITGTVVEAYIFMEYSWAARPIPASWITRTKPSSEYLIKNLREGERAYLRVLGFTVEDLDKDVDFLNLTARYHIQAIGGYEPLLSRRYSDALGKVWLDGVRRIKGNSQVDIELPDLSLFNPRSRILDLLNVRYLVAYENLNTQPNRIIERDGTQFDARDFEPASRWMLLSLKHYGDEVALVTTLEHARFVKDLTPVAKLRVHTVDGRVIERDLLAGQDTSEWSYDRDTEGGVIWHRRAPIFDSLPGDERASFMAHRYLARVNFGEPVQVARIEVVSAGQDVNVKLFKASICDSRQRMCTPMTTDAPGLSSQLDALRDQKRWEQVWNRNGVMILKNHRPLPRAWLVGSAEVVSPEAALRSIRGENEPEFDPEIKVLLESNSPEIAELPGDGRRMAGTAKPLLLNENQIAIKTKSETPAVLVVSEIDYPGWEATVDGNNAKIHTADYILRAVFVPAGEHRVEMKYTAPGAKRGAVISLFALLGLGGLVTFSIARRGRPGAPGSSLARHQDQGFTATLHAPGWSLALPGVRVDGSERLKQNCEPEDQQEQPGD